MAKMNETDAFGALVEQANRLVEQAGKLLEIAANGNNGKPLPGGENIDEYAFRKAKTMLMRASDRLQELAIYSMVPEPVEIDPLLSPNGWTDPD